MSLNKFKNIPIILGSQSPRRKELLGKMGFDFQVIVKETDEGYGELQSPQEIVKYIATNKILGFDDVLFRDTLVITADTIVVHKDEVLGKPRDHKEALETLTTLQGNRHLVLTGVALQYQGRRHCFVEETTVEFYPLSTEEILFYVERYHPFDKAGSYGIQEWIGLVGIKSITGAYENVVGLPTARLYQEMKKL